MVRDRHLLASPAFHLEPRLRVEAIDARVINHPAFLAQLEIDHARAASTVPMRQGDDALAQAAHHHRPHHPAP